MENRGASSERARTEADRVPPPSYSVEFLSERGWKVEDVVTLRSYATMLARDLAATSGLNHHVYLQTRTGKRKHIFTGRPDAATPNSVCNPVEPPDVK